MRYDITGMVHFLKGNWNKNWQSLVLRYIIHYHQLNWIEPLLVITIIFHSCLCSFNKHLLNINVVPVIDAGDKAANNRHMVSALMGILLYQLLSPSYHYPHHNTIIIIIIFIATYSRDKFSINGWSERWRKMRRLIFDSVLLTPFSYVHSYHYRISLKRLLLIKPSLIDPFKVTPSTILSLDLGIWWINYMFWMRA